MPQAFQRAARVIGLLVMSAGALVITGWAFRLPLVTTIVPGLPPMLPGAALTITLAGQALWLLQARRPPRIARLNRGLAYLLAASVTLIGGLTLGRSLGGWPMPLDQLLPGWADPGSKAGRMPTATALSLICIGLALLLLAPRRHLTALIAQILALIAALNGLRALLGILGGGDTGSMIASPTHIALHSALALVLLGVGLLCAQPRLGLMSVVSSPGYGSHVFRLLLPATVLLPLLIGALTLRSQQAGLFGLDFGIGVLTFANLMIFWWLARALNRTGSLALREARRAQELLELADRRTGRLQALRRVDQAIIHEHQAVGAMLDVVLEQTRSQLGVEAAAVLLLQTSHDRLVYARYAGFRTAPAPIPASGEQSYLGAALREHLVTGGPAGQVHRPEHSAAEGFVVGYAAPIMLKGQVTGLLEIGHRAPLDLDGESLGFLETLAGQTAIALATFRLFTDLERSNEALVQAYDETLAGWSYALELRDDETQGHTQRVTELTVRLAEAFGISGEELVHIRRGAMLHDIGKLGIPDSILLKSGQLTDEEWALMRRHPVYAYQWLRPIAYLWPALDIPYCHHERWDGTGYPRGLKGTEIPLAARIFTVVDVWDALCSERPYHLPWSIAEAKAYLIEHSGSHFDPEVVALFLQVVGDGNVVQARSVGA